ncbi:MAG TPA: glycosyltransferase [Conexibacter sp.]|nr:glycosyltransferase [Conexibacter sp.]
MRSRFADIADHHKLPVDERDQPYPRFVRPSAAALAAHRLRGEIRRRRKGRRLAYVDSMFPWRRSGFRYHEALAIHELLPETLFFSQWELNDPFPAPVHRLADFPAIAIGGGVTDAYAVFQLFLEGLVGLPPLPGQPQEHAWRGLDLTEWRRMGRIRMHGSIYPGGGLEPTPEGLARTAEVARRMSSTFSFVPEVIAGVPGVTPVDAAYTETSFYAQTSERWEHLRPLVCLFAADASPRKGLDAVLAAFAELDPADVHLHVVGPHLDRRAELPAEIATFHDWMTPDQLRDLHRRAHVFLSPVRAETATGPVGTYSGVVDGFPTQAAADAVSSGCLLVSANPARDDRVLESGVHYLERPPDAGALRATIREIAADPAAARATAEAGSARWRERMDVRRGTVRKLRHMGLLAPDA